MEKSQESLRLRIYEVYAWGMPIIITIVAAVLDNLPESPNDGFLRPRFGENKCWFYGEFLISFIFLSSKKKCNRRSKLRKKCKEKQHTKNENFKKCLHTKSCVKKKNTRKRSRVINTPFSL